MRVYSPHPSWDVNNLKPHGHTWSMSRVFSTTPATFFEKKQVTTFFLHQPTSKQVCSLAKVIWKPHPIIPNKTTTFNGIQASASKVQQWRLRDGHLYNGLGRSKTTRSPTVFFFWGKTLLGPLERNHVLCRNK